MLKKKKKTRPIRYNPKQVHDWLLARGFRTVRLSSGGDPAAHEWANYQLPSNGADEGDLWNFRLEVGVKRYHHPESDTPEPFWINTPFEINKPDDRNPIRLRTFAQFQAMIVTLALVGAEL